jgi:hypothetical protein
MSIEEWSVGVKDTLAGVGGGGGVLLELLLPHAAIKIRDKRIAAVLIQAQSITQEQQRPMHPPRARSPHARACMFWKTFSVRGATGFRQARPALPPYSDAGVDDF